MSTLEVKAIQAPSGYNLAMPAGHVVKDSFSSTTTLTTSTSTSAAATAITTAITPTSATNKMIITLNIQVYRTTSATGTRLWLYRDIGGGGYAQISLFNYYGGYANDGGTDVHNNVSVQLADTSYDSTSVVTYKVYMALSNGSGTVKVNQNGSTSSIYVQEVAQ